MVPVPDTPLRLRLRVALKLMAGAALTGGAVVVFAYLSGGPETRPRPEPKRIALNDLEPGEARTLRWQGRPVIVVRPRVSDDAGAGRGWFVAFASDPIHGCPVQWRPEDRIFRSTCSSARYGPRGRRRPDSAGPALGVPRHRIEKGAILVLGRGAQPS